MVTGLLEAGLPVVCVEIRHMKAVLKAQQVNKSDRNVSSDFQPLRRQVPLHLVEQPPGQIVLLEQVAEAAHRGLVRNRLAAEIDPDERRIARES